MRSSARFPAARCFPAAHFTMRVSGGVGSLIQRRPSAALLPLSKSRRPVTTLSTHPNGVVSVGLAPLAARSSIALLQNTALLLDCVQKLDHAIDLDDIAIDAAPFQLVLGTSLYKVHRLFSLLGLNHAYVTHRGRLVGVVSLREVGGKSSCHRPAATTFS